MRDLARRLRSLTASPAASVGVLPRALLSVVRRLLYPIADARKLYRSLRIDLWIAQGTEKHSLEPISVAYAADSLNSSYLLGLIFQDIAATRHIGRLWLWDIAPAIARSFDEVALTAVQIPKRCLRFLRAKNLFYVPCWVGGEVDISHLETLLSNSSIRSDMRRIRKFKLSYTIAKDPAALDDFYHNMYIPQVTGSHRDAAYVEPYEHIKEVFGQCELLLVRRDGASVGGIIIAYDKASPRLWSLGVRDARAEYRSMGVVGALFYFALEHLKREGYSKVGMGGSRAFLNDGVIQYKKKWQQRVVAAFGNGFALEQRRSTEPSVAFFMHNPFIFQDSDLNAAVFLNAPSGLMQDDVVRLKKDYLLPGLARLVVFRLSCADARVGFLELAELSETGERRP